MVESPETLLASLRDRFLDAQLRGDRRQAVQVLLDEGLGRGATPTDLLLRVITPAQHEIGRLWEGNQVSVADEHVATAISQLAMSYLYSRTSPMEVRREHVLIACVEGEWHDMGARVAADVLEHHGFSVRLLGPSVPVADLADRIRAEAPDVVLLSMTMPMHEASLSRTLDALRRDFPTLPVLAGGRGVSGPTPSEGSAVTPRARAVCAEIVRLLRG
ncbi:cobalamin B12-binding domain-containing protein [Luteitalea sp.]